MWCQSSYIHLGRQTILNIIARKPRPCSRSKWNRYDQGHIQQRRALHDRSRTSNASRGQDDELPQLLNALEGEFQPAHDYGTGHKAITEGIEENNDDLSAQAWHYDVENTNLVCGQSAQDGAFAGVQDGQSYRFLEAHPHRPTDQPALSSELGGSQQSKGIYTADGLPNSGQTAVDQPHLESMPRTAIEGVAGSSQEFSEEVFSALPHEETVVNETEEHSPPAIKQNPASTTYSYILGQATCVNIVQTLRKLRELGFPDQVSPSDEVGRRPLKTQFRAPYNDGLKYLSRKFKETNRGRHFNQEYIRLFRERKALPVQQRHVARKLKSLIEDNDVLVLVSETGSGKTTQIPQLILDWKTAEGVGAFCNVLCTQPRRLAAMTIAQRVAQEQATFVGGHVGYSVRFAKRLPTTPGSIGYWTAGVLLKTLYDDAESVVRGYSHLVIDEVHERDTTTDLVLTALRDLMRVNKAASLPFPKVILMSATIDALDFERYFADSNGLHPLKVASLEVPGRNYGVEIHMLDDIMPMFEQHSWDGRFVSLLQNSKTYLEAEDEFTFQQDRHESAQEAGLRLSSNRDNHGSLRISREPELKDEVPLTLVAATVAHALTTSDHGDVLVFLPGIGEIEKVKTHLTSHPLLGIDFQDTEKIRIYKLHASLYETNDQVFESIPAGCRRVILSTNIAQTSITLPDVVHVVDCGKQRRLVYESKSNVSEFSCSWFDQSASKQRRGRAGRTAPGHYWALLTQARYDSLPAKPVPEIKSIDLTQPCLAVKAQLGSEPLVETLGRCLDAPDLPSVEIAVEALKKLRMLTESEQITPLGRFAAWFPLPPATARTLLLGVLFRCLRPLLIMACHNSDKPLIYSGASIREQMQATIAFAGMGDDDRTSFVSAFEAYDLAAISHDHARLAELEGQNVRENAYREMVSVGRQLCNMMSLHGLLDMELDDTSQVFDQLPAYMSANAMSSSFTKSLALSMQFTKLGVWNEEQETFFANETAVILRPFSINARTSLKLLGRGQYNRRQGELVSYSSLLTVPGTKRPMMIETSSITPLMAMLFGAPIEVIGRDVIEIDGWLKYRVSLERSGTSSTDIVSPARLILEFRRTIDRFIHLACANVQNKHQLAKASRSHQLSGIGALLKEDNPITDALVNGLKAAIDSDALHWDEVVQQAGNAPRTGKPTAQDGQSGPVSL